MIKKSISYGTRVYEKKISVDEDGAGGARGGQGSRVIQGENVVVGYVKKKF